MIFFKVGNKISNTCNKFRQLLNWILVILPMSFWTSYPFFCFSRSHTVNIIYPFLDDFFPLTPVLYCSIIQWWLLDLARYVRIFTPFLNGLRLLDLGFVTCLTSSCTVSSYLTVQQIWYHIFSLIPHIQYGHSSSYPTCWGFRTQNIKYILNTDRGKAWAAASVNMVYWTERRNRAFHFLLCP